MSPGRAVSSIGGAGRGPMSSWLATPLSYVFNTGDFFAEHRQSTHSKKTPAEAGAKLPQIV